MLIGYLDFQHGPYQSDDAIFTVHGHYDTRDLPDLLAHYRVALVLYPSAGPETFSFTLTEAWKEGRPVLVPPIGALAERVEGTGAGWVMRDTEWRDEARMLDRLEAILAAPDELARASARRERSRVSPSRRWRGVRSCTTKRQSQGAPCRHCVPSRKDVSCTRSAIGRGMRRQDHGGRRRASFIARVAPRCNAPPGEACRPAVDAVRSRAMRGRAFP